MKEITIIWLNRSEAKLIVASPNDLIRSIHIQSAEGVSPSTGTTSEVRKTKTRARKDYYEDIVSQIESAREIVLFGPDNTKEEFLDFLSQSYRGMFSKVIGVESSQDIPEEKIIARGRKYL